MTLAWTYDFVRPSGSSYPKNSVVDSLVNRSFAFTVATVSSPPFVEMTIGASGVRIDVSDLVTGPDCVVVCQYQPAAASADAMRRA